MSVENLTPAQEQKLEEVCQEWIENGLSTDQSEESYCDDEILGKFYVNILNRKTPERVFWLESPLQCQLLANLLTFFKVATPEEIQGAGNAIYTYNRNDKPKGMEIIDYAWDVVFKKAEPYIPESAKELTKTYEQDIKNVKEELNFFTETYIYGNMDSWFAFYDYFYQAGILTYDELEEKFLLIREIYKGCNFIYALQEYCICSKRPVEISINDNGLHKDGGAALRYSDGLCVYMLNGVRVPKWLAEEKLQDIKVDKYFEIDNVEIRREFIRKIGIERFAEKSGAVCLDKEGDYELLEIDLKGQTGKCKGLKMLNPSIETWHIEWVHKNCKTVQDAINFRASEITSLDGDWKPDVLS